jgi:hypothetical protein|tara:strand:+ start:440 stop:1060 length:621 start_codon:yes stop_codon:yes gene_type:complete
MKHLLSSSAFLVVNKQLAKVIGLKETVLLADLISKEEYFIASGMTDGWFFNTEANIEDDTTLTPFQQRKCLKSLRKYGIIETKRRGVPAKQYFKINEQLVIKFLNNLSSSKCTTINKNKVITIHNKYFNKPKLSEVKDYCFERNNNIDAEAFIDFYESKGWMVGKNKMKDWKAAVRTWEKKNYNKPKGMSKLDAQINEWQEAKKLL